MIAVAVPAALADSSNGITPANGSDYILPDGSIYQQNDDGTFSWIPNTATANAMGLDWSNLIPRDSLPGAVGEPVPVETFPATSAIRSRTSTSVPPHGQAAVPGARVSSDPPGRQSGDQYSGCAARESG